jgi:hypothetical protein
MEKIAVKKQHIARIHLDVDKWETLEHSGAAFLVGSFLGLLPKLAGAL